MSSDASCEESSVREGAGYNETYGSGDKSDFSIPSERETSAQSPDVDESLAEGDKEEESGDGMDVDGEESDGDKGSSEGTSEGPGDNCPFILPEDWAVNKFLPRMSGKVFRELRVRYQIDRKSVV